MKKMMLALFVAMASAFAGCGTVHEYNLDRQDSAVMRMEDGTKIVVHGDGTVVPARFGVPDTKLPPSVVTSTPPVVVEQKMMKVQVTCISCGKGFLIETKGVNIAGVRVCCQECSKKIKLPPGKFPEEGGFYQVPKDQSVVCEPREPQPKGFWGSFWSSPSQPAWNGAVATSRLPADVPHNREVFDWKWNGMTEIHYFSEEGSETYAIQDPSPYGLRKEYRYTPRKQKRLDVIPARNYLPVPY